MPLSPQQIEAARQAYKQAKASAPPETTAAPSSTSAQYSSPDELWNAHFGTGAKTTGVTDQNVDTNVGGQELPGYVKAMSAVANALSPTSLIEAPFKAANAVNPLQLVKGTTKTFVQFPQAVVSGATRLPAEIQSYVNQTPIQNTALHQFGESMAGPHDIGPLGQVKGLSASPEDVGKAQTPGETAMQAANIWLEGGMPGAAELVGKGAKALGFGEGSFSKWANRMSTIPEETIQAAENPSVAKDIQALRSGEMTQVPKIELPSIPKPAKPVLQSVPEFGAAPGTAEEVKNIGQKAYETAQAQKSAAQTAYGETRRALVEANQGKLIQRSKEFVTGAKDAMGAEGIAVKNGKVSLVGSQFEGSKEAQGYMQRVYDLMTRPVVRGTKTVADDLLTRREALSTVMNDIPAEQSNLRRVVGNMRSAFDTTLDNIVGPEASAARASYAQSQAATRPVIKAMSKVENGSRVFSEDKAYSFVNNALKDSKFDNSQMLAELDKLAGTAHASDVEKIANARSAYESAISQAESSVKAANEAAKAKYTRDAAQYGEKMAQAKMEQATAQAAEKARLDALKQLNKALSQTTPELQSSMISVARRYATNIPVLKNFATFVFTPKFWGDIAITRGLKAAEQASKVPGSELAKNAGRWLLTNLIAAPTK